MDLEEEDDGGVGGGREGVSPRFFYDKTGNEVNTVQKGKEMRPDPHKRHMDRPGAVPAKNFARGVC